MTIDGIRPTYGKQHSCTYRHQFPRCCEFEYQLSKSGQSNKGSDCQHALVLLCHLKIVNAHCFAALLNLCVYGPLILIRARSQQYTQNEPASPQVLATSKTWY